ncbi:hypothetical protein L1987_87885 [Smallanthus sonchifolius]|nr:hypothetical protein L1987_87885 [Smallanthus sonchifolius]
MCARQKYWKMSGQWLTCGQGGLFSPSLQPLFLRSHSKFQLPFRDLINFSSDFASYSRNLVIFSCGSGVLLTLNRHTRGLIFKGCAFSDSCEKIIQKWPTGEYGLR